MVKFECLSVLIGIELGFDEDCVDGAVDAEEEVHAIYTESQDNCRVGKTGRIGEDGYWMWLYGGSK